MRTFTARFDSECQHCGSDISEGDDIAYIDDAVACEDCVAEAGDED